MSESAERARIIEVARTWIRTPFVWEACIKGVGCDCGRFLAAVFNEAGVKQIDIPNLPHLTPHWFLHRSDESYLNIIRQFAVEYELPTGAKPQPGDIVVAKQGRDWAHSALVVNWPTVIGAAYEHCVTLWPNVYLSPQYMNRAWRFFNPWGSRD